MPNKCACGGQLYHYGETNTYFRVKCDKCGVVRTQRKRQKDESQ